MSIAFVAGATGYTGREVVRALRQRGAETVAHVRPDSPRLEYWRDRFIGEGAQVDETPWDEQALVETLTHLQPTHVFALLGTTRARARRGAARGAVESYRSVDYGLTMLLLRAAQAAGSHPRFVYLSAAGVREHALGEYLRVRWEAESQVRASGLPFTIARPSLITGTDRDDHRPGERVAAVALDGVLALAGAFGARRLRERWRSTTNETLAAALVRLAFDPTAENAIVESEGLR